jgi:hypothetical protein
MAEGTLEAMEKIMLLLVCELCITHPFMEATMEVGFWDGFQGSSTTAKHSTSVPNRSRRRLGDGDKGGIGLMPQGGGLVLRGSLE